MTILRFLDKYFEISISVFLLLFMTALIAVQVFMRYVMGESLSWSEELARYVFIWLIYLMISYSAREMKHIKIDAALGLFPQSWQRWVVILGDLLFLAFALFIVKTTYELVLKQMMLDQRSTALAIPLWMIYAAPGVGFFLTAIRQVQTIIWRLRNPDKSNIEEF
ncbi:TRAP-type C4-dicarboxylate transport system, small permease component [Cohaesibacter marisflavi]|uniref:TRAP transporter small permease protein n=1 Tax=Cohaesibacter marisflavi TaxID=655353 RepID=A0A1I5CNE2_9HYPH|nr:TRAP transporter small permease [Cohaesibacter marisflavi]SFN88545.1 TRAP-type C4-dicarboxylate transport system, small permease component [Cohaesibacter marisflavi]